MQLHEYIQYDGIGLATLIADREISPREACEAALAVHAATDPQISAVIETWADEIDEAIAQTDPDAPFRGVPFFIKDIVLTMKGKKCEDGSRIAEGFVAPDDSALMKRFRNSGVITLGRSKTPEFGFSPTTEPVFPGPARNPWNPQHSPGGSSGGSGGVVASRVAPMAHASDGGGSIRIPASACGVVGLKPTRGRTSVAPGADEVLFGMGIEFIHSRTVRDTALMLDLVHGPEIGEAYEIAAPVEPYHRAIAHAPAPLRVGVMLHPMSGARSVPEVVEATEAAARLCAALGHHVEYATPEIGMTWDAFIEMECTAWCGGLYGWVSAMAELTGRTPGLDVLQPETYASYLHGKSLTMRDVAAFFAQRNVATRSFASFLSSYDVLLSPVLASLPYPIGTFSKDWGETGLDWTRHVFANCPFTPIFNVTGLPAISLPLGHDAETDLPIGIQFGAGFGREDVLLKLAAQIEAAQPWIGRLPKMTRAICEHAGGTALHS